MLKSTFLENLEMGEWYAIAFLEQISLRISKEKNCLIKNAKVSRPSQHHYHNEHITPKCNPNTHLYGNLIPFFRHLFLGTEL